MPRAVPRLKEPTAWLAGALSIVVACGGNGTFSSPQQDPADGPADQGPAFPHATGDGARGETVFRTGTFGNEGFWTDALRLPQGILSSGLTPVQALAAGLSVNVGALDPVTRTALANELASQGTSGPLLNDPATTIELIEANAVIGLVFVDVDGDRKLDLSRGDKVGVSCALCHAITDGSVLASPSNLGGGSIGFEVDGPTPHNLDVGGILALAENSRAFFPMLQVELAANGNHSIGRAPPGQGLTASSTELEVDAFLRNRSFYPLGSFDDGPDGNGAPQRIQPLFRTDLSAPWGTPGEIAVLDNFSNVFFTIALDPTILVTPDGRNFLKARVGEMAGDELADGFLRILTETGVTGPGGTVAGTGFPFVRSTLPPGVIAGTEAAPAGRRIDERSLLDLNVFMNGLRAPRAPAGLDPNRVVRGREVFRTACTSCHNVDQRRRVPSFIVAERTIFPGFTPVVLAERPVQLPFRPIAFDPIENDFASIFDDKTVVIDASQRGDIRGSALPLLLDLARKDRFLHDGSVVGLEALLDPSRGANAPHPFFVTDPTDRDDVAEFLRSLEAT